MNAAKFDVGIPGTGFAGLITAIEADPRRLLSCAIHGASPALDEGAYIIFTLSSSFV
jgi:hypothetical protein